MGWMDKLRIKDRFNCMPHNSNGSNGQMFEVEQFDGSPLIKIFRIANEE